MKKIKSFLVLASIILFSSFALAAYSNLKTAITASGSNKTYSLTKKETVTADLGVLLGNLTVYGNGYEVYGANYMGVTIGKDNTLNINKGSGNSFVWSNFNNDEKYTEVDDILYFKGGAIYNKGNLNIGDNITFKSNNVHHQAISGSGKYMYGGAIYNDGGKIVIDDNCKFDGNFAVSSVEINGRAYGGAIYNTEKGDIQIGNNVIFNNNFARTGDGNKRGYGGAIFNNTNSKITIGSDSVFTSNNVYKNGGAINNYQGSLILGSNAIFDSNKAYNSGGAIYNVGTVTILDGAKFTNNTAATNGGAIYNEGKTINLVANTNNIEFTGNTANGVSNAINSSGGTINLWASENADVIFNDRIKGSGTTNINKSTTTLTANGKIVLNEDMSGYTGKVNLYNGEIELQAKKSGNVNTNKFFSGDINLSSGTLNILNNAIDNITVSNFTSTENSNLKFDANLSNNTSDNFTVTNSASGELNLSAINLLGVNEDSGQITLFKNTKSPTLNILTSASYGGYEYTFTNSGTTGVLNYERGAELDLKNAVNKTEPPIRSYSLAGNETVTEDLGNLGGTQLTIFGNGYEVDGNGTNGIQIGMDQTLNIYKGIGENFTWSNFVGNYDGGVIHDINEGTLNIGSDVIFSSNTASRLGGAICNDYGIVTIEGGTEFKNNVANFRGGAIFNNSGRIHLIANTDNIEFTGNTANGVSNAIHDSGGRIFLWASENAKIIFNDRISSDEYYSSDLHINISTGILVNSLQVNISTPLTGIAGKVVLNEDMSGYVGTVVLYDGELELQAKTEEGSNVNTNKFFSGNINLSSGTLNILNSAVDNIMVSNLTTTANANLKFDTDLSNNTSDNFTVTNNATGELNLAAINILDVSGDSGQITLFNNSKSPTLNILTNASYGGYEYTFTNSDVAGILNYQKTGVQQTFKGVVNATEPLVRSYSLAENEIVTEDLGNLGGTQLTIFGNGYEVNGSSKAGITVGSGQKLNIEKGTGENFVWENFSKTGHGTVIFNEGTTNISENVEFSSNTGTRWGGAIYNNNTLNVDSNVFTSNTAKCGGAVINFGGITDISSSTFTNNMATLWGGALENTEDGILNVYATAFSSNIATQSGGAIQNLKGTTTISSSTFIGNSAQSYGGAIANEEGGTIIISSSMFSRNQTDGTGGAINNAGNITIGENVTFEQNSSAGRGGAIFNSTGTITINSNVFSSNIATGIAGKSAYGGAIYNSSGTIIISSSIFDSNTAAVGGAIDNSNILATTIIKSTVFNKNTATTTAGALSNGGTLIIEDSSFTDNISQSYGGAILSIGTLNLIANKKNVEFTGNTANGISNAIHDDNKGTINLWASENADIIFNDRITSKKNSSTLNINSSTTTLNAVGKVVLNEDMSGYTGQVNLYGGEIELQAKTTEADNINTNKFFSGNINLSSGTLNILNNTIDNVTLSTWTSTVNTSLKFDTDLSNNTSDNFTVKNSATGILNLTAINLLGVNEDSGQITLFNDGKSPTLNVLTTGNYGGYEYTFTNSDISGVLNYEKTGLVAKTFKEVVNAIEPAIRSYSFSEDEIVTDDLGNLGGEQLTIFGNGYEIDGNERAGINVSESQILNIDKSIGEDFSWNSFSKTSEGGVFYVASGATLNLGSNINFSTNSSTLYGGVIYNNGYLNIEDNGYYYNNSAQVGGALLNFESGSMSIGNDNYFENNRATNGEGGAIENCGTLTVSSGTSFVLNQATTNGGAISNAMYINGDFVANVNIGDYILFSSNTANYGGALSNISATAIIGENNVFEYNNSINEGGAIYNSKNDYKDTIGQIAISSNTKFLNNTAIGLGGAIFNNSGIITIGSTATFNNNSAYNGGAIASLYVGSSSSNTATHIQIGDNATFSSNTATQNGGAIYNETGTINIGKNSKFELNKTTITANGANGGAIANFGTMLIDENANFISNNTGTSGSGGAIHNCKNHDGTIANLTIKDGASFTSNTATSGGGAISNYNGGIINILDNVSFISNTANKFGGAILNYSSDNTINAGTVNIGNNARFINNTAQTDCGGAITNSGIFTIGESATFDENSSAGSGGAIYNSKRGNITIGKNVTFSNNIETENGGAIHNEGILTLLDGGSFINNRANGSGGAIYLYNDNITEIPNSRTVNLIANTNNIEFTGNTANGISNAIHSNGGTINLWASQYADIIFNDRITSTDNTSILNINSSTTTLTANGKVVLNEDMSGYTGSVILHGGEIELQAKTEEGSNVNTNKFFSGDINLSSGTLNILNNSIDNITVTNLTTTSNTNLKFDTDLSNNTSDNFTVTNSAIGTLNLTAINILGVDENIGQITLFNDEISPELNVLTTGNYGGQEYVFTNSDVAGVLNYRLLGYKTFKEVVNETEPAIRSYSFSGDEIVTEGLENLGGEQLTIFGNGYDIDANNVEGITIYYENQILNIEGVKDINGFTTNHSGGAIMNHGTLNIGEGISFTSNSSLGTNNGRGGAIYNYNPNAKLNIADNVSFTSNTASIQGGAIHDYFGAVNIGDNVTFTSNTSTRGGGAVMSQSGNKYFTIGKNSKFNNNSVSQGNGGGAILNLGYFNIGSSATFSNNKETAVETTDGILAGGGAIHNLAGIDQEGTIYNAYLTIGEYSLFENNQSNNFGGAILNNIWNNKESANCELTIKDNAIFTSNTARNGGAVANLEGNVIIGNNIIFSSNTAKSISGLESLGGGAIYNMGNMSIGSETVFNENNAVNNNGYARGGAIYQNCDGVNTGNTILNFSDNISFTSNTAQGFLAYGGAIDVAATVMFGNNITFSSNSTNASDMSYGGAIAATSANITIGDNLNLNSNKAESLNDRARGGAIYSVYTNILVGENANIKFNNAVGKLDSYGGAIYNYNPGTHLQILDGAIFSSNTVVSTEGNAYGGAIYNGNGARISLIANTNNVEFTGNTANGVSNAIHSNGGVINLWASDNASVIFNDRITSSDDTSILNINQSSGTLPTIGKVVLNEDMSGYNGQVNLYGGEIELQAKTNGNNTNTNKFFTGNINLSSGTLNILNNAIDNITVNNLTTTENSNLKFDTDLSNNTSDNFTVTNTAEGTLNLTAINILGTNIGNGQITLFNNEISPELNVLTTANYGGYEYTFTKSDTAGVLNYEQTGTTKTFKEVVNDTIPQYRSYSFAGKEIVTENLGQLGGTQLTIFGNGYEVDGNGKAGIKVSNGQTLNIEKGVGEQFVWKNFNKNDDSGGAIYNRGILDIGSNVNFTSNTAMFGGAINSEDSILNIGNDANFSYNKVIGTEDKSAQGGAISTNRDIVTIGDNVTFYKNEALEHGSAGAIDSGSDITIGNNAKFIENSATYSGAIYNDGNLIIGNNALFDSNYSTNYGGAINNKTGRITFQDGVQFLNNSTDGTGGAINNSNVLNLIANTNDVEFTGNTANGISNAIYDNGGTINLWASENADVIFNDRITSEDDTSILNINSSTTTLTANGKVILNEDMSGWTGTTNLYDGNLIITEGNNFVNGDFTIHGGTLTANANSIIKDFTNNGTVDLTGGTIAYNISGLSTGIININNDEVTINDDVYINNNNIKLGTGLKLLNEESLNTSTLSISNGAILNTQNNSTGTINASSIVIEDGANWTYQLDVDLKSAKADNLINIQTVGNESSALINDIHLLSDKATKTSILIADNDINATIDQNNLKIYTTNLSYAVTTEVDSNSNTLLNIEATGYGGLANAIYDGISSYSVTEETDYLTKWIEDPIETINNELKGNLNINGNNKILKSTTNAEGLTTEEYTLQINNVNLEGFNEAIKVNNANGNLQLTNVEFSNNTGNAIITSSGTVELSGVIFDNTNNVDIDVLNDNKLILSGSSTTFTTGVIGKGTTTISGVDINLAEAVIEQNKIEIKDGGSLTANASNITADIENNSSLVFAEGGNSNYIFGNGATIIDGEVINSSTIVNNVIINENKQLTTSASDITGNINNSGNYVLTVGENSNYIFGNGATIIDGEVINSSTIVNNV
ncbi:MAG: hypothetical protein IKN62_03775, partial [Elusimicrobia bacterium]|nr:hypothetical protein [Elusimicrobiota bacterium]